MAMTRTQLRRQAIIARYHAGKNKPLERRRIQSFMSPITQAINHILNGSIEIDENDVPITRLAHNDNWEPVHACINGVVDAMERLMPDIDMGPLRWVSSDLGKGKLMSHKKAMAARQKLREIEDRLTKKHTWNEVVSSVNTTQIKIQLERLGLLEAA